MINIDEQVLAKALASALVEAQKASPATTATTVSWPHGPGGLFASSAIEQNVISARMTPRGLSRVLPVRGSRDTNPEFAYITGITHQSGWSEPSTECYTCPSGELQKCIQTAQFGLVCRETKTLTVNRMMERINRGDMDVRIFNDVLGLSPTDIFQAIRSVNYGTISQMAVSFAMMTLGALMQSRLVPMVWRGNPANNVGTGYKEFPGLDLLISRNYFDAHTGVACPALDADIKDFRWRNVNWADAAGNFEIVTLLSMMEAYVYHNADRQGFTPATWAWVMRPELWRELTEIWPAVYLTTRGITLPASNTVYLDATRINEMRDQMRAGLFLTVNGRQHPVILDDGILEYTPATGQGNLKEGEYASNIYLIPLTVTGEGGRMDVTFFEAKDYRADIPWQDLPGDLRTEFWTDDGRFLWTTERVKWCFTVSAKVEPRILLLTPQLSGRVNYVKYSPHQHLRSADEDSDYFFKGGVSKQPAPSLYSPWNMPGLTPR